MAGSVIAESKRMCGVFAFQVWDLQTKALTNARSDKSTQTTVIFGRNGTAEAESTKEHWNMPE